jgi:NAD(P)-dependent dehydrogenase (short-subunit alcohol dehydrogenase family)
VTPFRWDSVEVIGRAIAQHVAGAGVRRIAAVLGRPETTVREWCRRFGAAAGSLGAALLAAAVRQGWSGFDLPVAPGPRCLAATEALASTFARRHGPVAPWRLANLVTGGTFLAPNTTSPLAARSASSLMARTPRSAPGGPRWPPISPKPAPSGATT